MPGGKEGRVPYDDSRVGQLDYSNDKDLIAQVKTCVDSWVKHILWTTNYILHSHFLGHLCDDSRVFVSHLADTVYYAITELTNKITYDCRHKSVTYTAKFKEAVRLYINESGNVKYQFCTSVTIRFGRVIKFTPTGDGYNLCTNPDSTSNGDRESYPTSVPYNGIHQFNTGTSSVAYYEYYVSKGNLNFMGAAAAGQSQQQMSTATQLHNCQQQSKLGQKTLKKNQEHQKNRKKNHKRHEESLAPHVDVPVNVNYVEVKNSTRSTTFQGLQLEQSKAGGRSSSR